MKASDDLAAGGREEVKSFTSLLAWDLRRRMHSTAGPTLIPRGGGWAGQ